MNGRMLARRIAPLVLAGVVLALTGCATSSPRELSILEAIDTQQGFNAGPQSCAALDAATVCVQSMRFDRSKECGCADRYSISEGKLFRF
jgi:hypothetical protein